jgi:hypothetical protein
LLLSGALAGGLSAAPKRSLSESDLEAVEVRSILERALTENERLEEDVALLQEKLTVAETTAKRLTESVAVAHAEAEVFRRQSGEQKLKLEALGIAGGSGNPSKVEQRLLTAVNDLRHGETERKKLTEALIALTEAAMNFTRVATTKEPDARAALETQVLQATALLGDASPNAVELPATPATLTDGMIISLKDELALVVANVGTKQGVAVGMPFQVLRGSKVIGTVRVVDARERIAGAIIQNLSSEKEKIKVGDRLKIAARQ